MHRFSRHAALLLIALCLLTCVSCNENAANTVDKPADAQTESTVSVTVASVAEFEDVVKSHTGKVVVADLWAMW